MSSAVGDDFVPQHLHRNVATGWARIEHWFTTNAPAGVWSLAPGASHEAITAAESVIGLRLTSEVLESYLLHDGNTGGWVFADWSYLSLIEMTRTWQAIEVGLNGGYFSGTDFIGCPQGPIRPDWHHPMRVPVGDNQNGDYIFIDYAPARGGQVGQVIEYTRDNGPTRVLATSFGAWLDRVAGELEAGNYVWGEYGMQRRTG
jgi:cell wall assembly regulator SMI1